jgi:hypothetical protein
VELSLHREYTALILYFESIKNHKGKIMLKKVLFISGLGLAMLAFCGCTDSKGTGEGKCGQGKCDSDKKVESKCGEGKCDSGKKAAPKAETESSESK